MDLQESLKTDVEKQVNTERKDCFKYTILNDTIKEIDDRIDIPSIHCLINNTTQDNIDDVILSISVLINSGANVDEHRDNICVLERLLSLKNHIKSGYLETVIEMIINKSQIDYKTYKHGALLTVLKEFSALTYIKFRLITDSTEDFLSLMEDHSYCPLIQKHLFTITSRAVAKDSLIIVEKLFEVYSKKTFENREMSDLLKKSVASGNLDVLKFLWEKVETLQFTLSTPFLVSSVQEIVNVKSVDIHKYYECFDYVLRMNQTDVNQRDNAGNVALYYACKYDDEYMIEELLKAKTWIGNKNERGELTINRIDAKKLEKYLDSCFKTSLFSAQFHQISETNNLVFFDYSCFVSPETENYVKSDSMQPHMILEMDVVNFIAENSNLSHLISHPLLRAFVQLKWRRFWPFIFINQQCSLFFLIITVIILTSNFQNASIKLEDRKWPIVAFGSLAIFLEIIRLALLRLRYFMQPINLLYIISIIFSFWFAFHCFCFNFELNFVGKTEKCEQQRVCYRITGCLALVLSIKFTILLYTCVSHTVGIYTVMLTKVAYNSFICILSNLILFLGFSFAFFAIFNNFGNDVVDDKKEKAEDDKGNGINAFSTIGKAFYKVYLMFTGEMDAADLIYLDTWSYFLLAGFVFIGPIVAFNLLNGLAVDDVQQIRCEAERISLRILCLLVTDFDYMLHSPFLKFYNRIVTQMFQINTNLISIFHRKRMPFGRIAVDLATYDAYTFSTRYDMFDRRNKKFLYKFEKKIVKDAEKIVMGDAVWDKNTSKNSINK